MTDTLHPVFQSGIGRKVLEADRIISLALNEIGCQIDLIDVYMADLGLFYPEIYDRLIINMKALGKAAGAAVADMAVLRQIEAEGNTQ
ncbi:MAG: hypothetical protein ABL907_10690 [Hyphomicrobium sp.]